MVGCAGLGDRGFCCRFVCSGGCVVAGGFVAYCSGFWWFVFGWFLVLCWVGVACLYLCLCVWFVVGGFRYGWLFVWD